MTLETQELVVLEFCCEVSSMPYNRRTSCSLKDVTLFITSLKRKEGDEEFQLSKREAFKWWWAFTKKHHIISLYYQQENDHPGKLPRPPAQEYIFHLLNCTHSIPISIPTRSRTQQSFPLPKLPTNSRYQETQMTWNILLSYDLSCFEFWQIYIAE